MTILDVAKSVPGPHGAKFNEIRRQTKQFVFDTAASEKLGRFSVDCADLVLRQADFALPPYPMTYIEIDNNAALSASGSLREDSDPVNTLGFLFLHFDGAMAILSFASDSQHYETIPWSYSNGGGFSDAPEAYQRSKKDLFIGQVSPDIRDATSEAASTFLSKWDYELTRPLDEQSFRALAAECRGGLKRALAALLLLNNKDSTRVTGEVKPHRKIHRGKLKTFMGHSTVTIDLAPQAIRRTFITGTRETPRRHQVRGHFVHYHKVAGCEHDYVQFEATEVREDIGKPVQRWKCKHCGTLRVFRNSFSRGDGSKGWVTKNYEVTSSIA